jgi:hypothetical protein
MSKIVYNSNLAHFFQNNLKISVLFFLKNNLFLMPFFCNLENRLQCENLAKLLIILLKLTLKKRTPTNQTGF